MQTCDKEFKDIIVRVDFSGNIVFKESLKNVELVMIDLKSNSFSIRLNSGFMNTYSMKNHDPLENYNFSIQ